MDLLKEIQSFQSKIDLLYFGLLFCLYSSYLRAERKVLGHFLLVLSFFLLNNKFSAFVALWAKSFYVKWGLKTMTAMLNAKVYYVPIYYDNTYRGHGQVDNRTIYNLSNVTRKSKILKTFKRSVDEHLNCLDLPLGSLMLPWATS